MGVLMESLQLDTPKNEPSQPWWRHRWLRATSLIVAGVLAGSIVGNDGEAQIAELQRQLDTARAAAQPSDGPSQTRTIASLERQLRDRSQELGDTSRELKKTERIARQRRRRMAALKNDMAALMSENASLLAAAVAAKQQPLVSSADDMGEADDVAGGECDLSYPDVCIPTGPPDLDCPDIGYSGFRVAGPDPHGFDDDSDGVGCVS
jgi:hypothetical protein